MLKALIFVWVAQKVKNTTTNLFQASSDIIWYSSAHLLTYPPMSTTYFYTNPHQRGSALLLLSANCCRSCRLDADHRSWSCRKCTAIAIHALFIRAPFSIRVDSLYRSTCPTTSTYLFCCITRYFSQIRSYLVWDWQLSWPKETRYSCDLHPHHRKLTVVGSRQASVIFD